MLTVVVRGLPQSFTVELRELLVVDDVELRAVVVVPATPLRALDSWDDSVDDDAVLLAVDAAAGPVLEGSVNLACIHSLRHYCVFSYW